MFSNLNSVRGYLSHTQQQFHVCNCCKENLDNDSWQDEATRGSYSRVNEGGGIKVEYRGAD